MAQSKKDNITHNRYKRTHTHSITVNGIEGKRVDITEVARNGKYAAIADIRCTSLPMLFKIADVPYYSISTLNKAPLRSTQHTIVSGV